MTCKTKIYGYAEVGSFGLTHSLLSWARCRLWCNYNKVPMLAPSWLHLRGHIGPILRREYDSRQYHRLFRFPSYVNGLHKHCILSTFKHVSAESADLENLSYNGQPTVLIFKNSIVNNDEDHFHNIRGRSSQVLKELKDMTKSKYLPVTIAFPHIAIHVRMGDFIPYTDASLLRKAARNRRLPIDWYCSILASLQKRLGKFNTYLYSDGTNEELMPLLRMQGVVRSPRQSSVTDLLCLSQAKLVVTSGSGFGTWGSYLGNSPRICYPGQRFVRVLDLNPDIDFEPECETGDDIKEDFLCHVAKALFPL